MRGGERIIVVGVQHNTVNVLKLGASLKAFDKVCYTKLLNTIQSYPKMCTVLSSQCKFT